MTAVLGPHGIVEARFTQDGSLGLVLSDARRDTAKGASTSIVRLRQVIPGTQAAAMTVSVEGVERDGSAHLPLAARVRRIHG